MAASKRRGTPLMDRRGFLASGLAAAGGLGLASGAAASTARALGAKHVNLLYWQYIGLYDPTEVHAIKRFTGQYPTLGVRYQQIPWNQYWQKLGATLTAGGPPDVWNTAPTLYYEYINRGQLLNLDPYVKRDYDLKDNFGKTLYMWQSPPNHGPY